MSEIVRHAYEGAIIKKYPISQFMDTDLFSETLEKIVQIFGKSLKEVLENFSLKTTDVEYSDECMISWVIKECLPKNPLYQKELFIVTADLNPIHYKEKTYRIYVKSQRDNLRAQDTVWVWENKDTVDKFMEEDNPIYRKLKEIESLFPLNIIVVC